MTRPIADLVAGFDFPNGVALGDEDLAVGVMVLVKAVDDEGIVSVSIAHSEGLDWLSRLGMVEFAAARLRDP